METLPMKTSAVVVAFGLGLLVLSGCPKDKQKPGKGGAAGSAGAAAGVGGEPMAGVGGGGAGMDGGEPLIVLECDDQDDPDRQLLNYFRIPGETPSCDVGLEIGEGQDDGTCVVEGIGTFTPTADGSFVDFVAATSDHHNRRLPCTQREL